MAFWGGPRLAAKLRDDEIIKPFHEGQIDCNSYTLRMGSEYFITPEPGASLWQSSKRFLSEKVIWSEPKGKFAKLGEGFTIPPGQFAFLLSHESVKIPKDAMGFISLRSGLKFKGLINVSGFHVDPGFEGNLIYSVFNAGPSAIPIARGDLLFKLWIADLDDETECEEPDQKEYIFTSDKPQTAIPSEIIAHVTKEVTSIQQMAEQLRRLENRLNGILWVGGILVAAAGLFFAAARFLES